MKKFLVLILSTIFILGACGQSKSDKKGKTVSFTDQLNKGNHVVLLYEDSDDEIDKDQYLDGIANIEDGKATLYNFREKHMNVGEAEKKSDKDLVKMAKKEDKKAFKDAKRKKIDLYENLSSSDDDKFKEDNKKELKEAKKLKYKEPKKQTMTTEVKAVKGTTKTSRIETSKFDDDSDDEINDIILDYNSDLNEEFNSVCKPKKVGSTKMIGLVKKTSSGDNLHAIMRSDDNVSKVTL